MKLNIKARLHNKTFVVSIGTLVLAFVYQLLSLLDITPKISESTLANLLLIAVNFLSALGVLVDPTTSGFSDSERAMKYFSQSSQVITDGENEYN